jgi:uncharacterized protein (DUF58 family)
LRDAFMQTIPARLRALFTSIAGYSDEISLVVIGIFLYVAAGTTQTGWLYFIDSLILAVLVLGYVIPRRNMRDLQVWREYPGHCFEGDEISITLHIRNTSGRHKYLISVIERFDEEYLTREGTGTFPLPLIAPHETKTITYTMKALCRGIYHLGGCRLQTRFPFGFFPATLHDSASDRIVVYPMAPALERLSESRASLRLFGQGRSLSLPGRSFDFLGIRAYQPSDGIRFIHWPISARLGKLMLKEFKDSSRQHIFTVLDMGRNSQAGRGRESTIEYEVKMAAGILNYSIRERGAMTILSAAGNEIIETPADARFRALDFLAGVQNEADISTSEILRRHRDHVPQGSILLLLQTEPSIDYEVLRDLKAKNVSLTVVWFVGSSFQDAPASAFEEVRYDRICNDLRSMGGISIIDVRKGDNLAVKLGQARIR